MLFDIGSSLTLDKYVTRVEIKY